MHSLEKGSWSSADLQNPDKYTLRNLTSHFLPRDLGPVAENANPSFFDIGDAADAEDSGHPFFEAASLNSHVQMFVAFCFLHFFDVHLFDVLMLFASEMGEGHVLFGWQTCD